MYFKLFQDLIYHIPILDGGGKNIVTTKKFQIFKTTDQTKKLLKNMEVSTENSSGKSESSYDVSESSCQITEIIDKKFTHLFLKACKVYDFPEKPTAQAIKKYLALMTDK